MEKKRLLIIHPTIAPYRVDLFNHLNESFETRICLFYKNQDTHIFNYFQLESQLGFVPIFLKKRVSIFGKTIYGGIWQQLKEFRPDIVMVGEFGLSTLSVILFKLFSKRSFKVSSLCDDSYNMVAEHNDFSITHRLARRIITPMLDDLILVDSRVVEWYQHHYQKGVYFPIIRDDKKARNMYNDLLPRSLQTAETHNILDKYVYLFVGRLIPLKNVETIIKAFFRLKQKNSFLVIIGDGELKSSLMSNTSNANNVIFTGRLEGDDLYLWYNIADCLVLASYQEAFGAVTNEALIAGCWSIVSEKAGSQCLIREGKNGYTFNPRDVEELKEKMMLSYEQRPIHNRRVLRDNLMFDNYHSMVEALTQHLYTI